MFIPFLIANTGLGTENAISTLEDSIQLTQETAESWKSVWNATIATDSELWIALVKLGIFLAAIGLIWVALTKGKEILEKSSWFGLVDIFIFPMVIVFFLSGNGFFLAQTIKLIKDIAYFQVNSIMGATALGISFSEALRVSQNNSLANQRVMQVFGDCLSETQQILEACYSDPDKLNEAQELLTELSNQGGVFSGNLLESIMNLMSSDITEIARDFLGQLTQTPIMWIITTLLWALQWAFVNGLEATLILTALLAPVALGLSMIPIAGRAILSWGIGFISLFGIQLGYTIVVGITAIVLNQTSAEGANAGTVASDLAFLVFLALIAPVVASALATLSGISLYQGISRASADIVNGVTNAVGAAVNGVILFFI